MVNLAHQHNNKWVRLLQSLQQLGMIVLLLGAMLVDGGRSYAQEEEEEAPANNHMFLPIVANTGEGGGQRTHLIPGQYIVVFKTDLVAASSVASIAADMTAHYGGEILQTYGDALQGFAARFPLDSSATTIASLQQDERVAYVEQDALITGDQEPESYPKNQPEPIEGLVQAAATDEIKSEEATVGIDTVQTGPVWGLDRNDQHFLPLNGKYIYFNTGAGVRVYIIDSGIRTAHSQFGGRASHGFDAIDGVLPADDCVGHGTHVAGTVGGKKYGVAKKVSLIAVRVLDCNNMGSTSAIIAGVNWVTLQKRLNPSIPSVANMSLGGPASPAMDSAVINSINAGVTYVVSAGNSNTDACTQSPARAVGTITVGATDITDTRATFSNFGGCVDIFAPGVGIKSAWNPSNSATTTMNGTSMAAPHVTGVVALFLQSAPNATPSTVRTTIFGVATGGIVNNPGPGSFNRLLYNPY